MAAFCCRTDSRSAPIPKEKRVCVLFALCMLAFPLHAVDITELQVYENSGIYSVKVVAEIGAPAEYVHRTLTDYEHLYRLNPSITESRVLPSPGGGAVRVRTRILDCIFIFCMEIDRVEDVYELPTYGLHAVIVPALSDFRSGKAHWLIDEIDEKEDRSQVIYEAQIEPDFIIFPIIGTSIVKEMMRQEMAASLDRIECIARIQEELDWNPHLQVAGADASIGPCQP